MCGMAREPEPAVLRYAPTESVRSQASRPWLVAFWATWAMVVCAGLLVLAFLVQSDRLSSASEIRLAKYLVSSWGALATQIEKYRRDAGHFPADLQDLAACPASPDNPERKPYIKDPSSLRDAWGNPLQYRFPGVHNQTRFDLWSTGPDGVNGTADDIGNW
jgi:general secretion pathway protein G